MEDVIYSKRKRESEREREGQREIYESSVVDFSQAHAARAPKYTCQTHNFLTMQRLDNETIKAN